MNSSVSSVAQTLVFMVSLSVAVSLNCNFLKVRTAHMRQLTITSIAATRLNDMSLTTVIECSSYCLGDDTCLYVTVDKMASKCTFYAGGSANFNVSHLQTFELMERMIQVQSL